MQALRKPFDKVTVIYGHEHQIQYNQMGNISFHSAMATAWPWPYPSTDTRVETWLPRLTEEMNRATPFFERDATGWQFINMHTGNVDMSCVLPDNTKRVVAFDTQAGKPVDSRYQARSCSPGAGSAVCRAGPGRSGPLAGEYMAAVEVGEQLFHGGLSSSNTVSCDPCHPKQPMSTRRPVPGSSGNRAGSQSSGNDQLVHHESAGERATGAGCAGYGRTGAREALIR